jgi:hypothetical protein
VPRTFDLHELATASAADTTINIREEWLTGRELRRWLEEQDIAHPNGEPDRMQLTTHGVELVALVAHLPEQSRAG